MDPKAAIERLVDLITEGAWDDADATFSDLRDWAERGGFMPPSARVVFPS